MTAMQPFMAEADLACVGAGLADRLMGDTGDVRAMIEVRAPGAVPDLVLFHEHRGTIAYVVTVEFKLRDWRRALVQAFRHRNVGNEAYVVLDRARFNPTAPRIDRFRRANVGLLTLDTTGALEVWHLPTPTLPFSDRFARVFAKSLWGSENVLPDRLPFTRTVRLGSQLANMRRWLLDLT